MTRTASSIRATIVVGLLSAACASGPATAPSREILLNPNHPEWTRPAPPVSRDFLGVLSVLCGE